jgi:glycerophosphoryl diester phosphodiesterase
MQLLFAVLLISITSMAQIIQVTAHRGASGYAPENTLASIRNALEIGVDRIEIDVQQTSDGVVVLLHDKTLDRTTTGKGKVGKMTLKQLDSIHANANFEAEFPEEPIPTLEQVFELLDGTTEFVIEIKAGNRTYPEIEDNVAALIKKFDAQKWALVHSFNDRVLKYLHKNHPEVRLKKLFVSYSCGLMLDFKLHAVKLSKYDFVEGFGAGKGTVNSKLVEEIHSLGKTIHAWTVNKEEDIQEMVDYGVDGLVSNYPDKAKQLVLNK